MNLTTNQPMKTVFSRAALCGVFALTAAAQWNTAQALDEREGRKGGVAPKIHQKAAPKAAEHAKLAERREAPRRERNVPKGVPHEGPKVEGRKAEVRKIEGARVAAMRHPISIRNLEFVAHLRRELFAHHWSFVYAAGLKHAPKNIRFLQDGTVATELKGEKWYWEPVDGRRVSLRTLADPNQPAITLEFNEGYTNFQYVLPNQTVAVQGAPLDAIAEAPAASSSAEGAPKTLEDALLTYQWNWNDVSGTSDAAVRFDKNKSFRISGRTSFWNVTGPRTVHVEFENGDQTDLLFDTTFSDYTDGNRISGFRVTAQSDVANTQVKQ
jgi:hypothetical protein